MKELSSDEVESIVAALAESDALRLPARLSKGSITHREKHQYLQALLRHDPGVFLERHGKLVSKEQRAFFEPLRNESYEVDFYLKLYEDEDQQEHMKGSASATAKNRRLAKMTRLAKEGYFDVEVARKRAPLLHHHFLGQQSGSQTKPRPSTLHDQIIQQHEEQQVRAKMIAEKREEDEAGEAFEATLTESESDDENEDDDNDDLGFQRYEKHAEPIQDHPVNLTTEEIQQNQEDFQAIMKERFLNGEDGGKEADNDPTLDEDWAREQTQDIEDVYFET